MTPKTLLPLSCLFLLAACGGGGGGGSTPPPAAAVNLKVGGMKLVTPDPNAAHEVDLDVTVSSTTALENVSISYYLLHKGDVDSGVENPRQFLIDSAVIDAVTAGDTPYKVNLRIPPEVEPAGDWYLTTRVDPLDQIEEANEEDNVPPEAEPDISIPVGRNNRTTPDFFIESAELDLPSLVLFKNRKWSAINSIVDHPDHHGGVTVEFRCTGDGMWNNVGVKLELKVGTGNWQRLQIWRPDTKRYSSTLLVDVVPDRPNEVQVDFHLLDSQIVNILAGLRNGVIPTSAKLRVTLNSQNMKEWEGGNLRIGERPDGEIELPITLVDPIPLVPPACYEEEIGFKKNWSNKFIGTRINFHAGSYLDSRGAVAEAKGSVGMRLFKKNIPFFDAECYGQLAPHEPSETQFHIDVKLFDQVVYTRASKDPNYTYTDTPFKKVQTIERQSVVFCGPVPIVFKAGAQGTLGYKLQFDMDSGNMVLTGTPYADLTARASATVNLVVAKGGVKGTMQVIREDFETRLSFGQVRLLNNGQDISAALNLKVTNTLTGPNGRIWLFCDYPGVKFCKTFLGRIPCGVKNHHKERTLVRFSTFEKVDVLLNETLTKTVTLNCQ